MIHIIDTSRHLYLPSREIPDDKLHYILVILKNFEAKCMEPPYTVVIPLFTPVFDFGDLVIKEVNFTDIRFTRL